MAVRRALATERYDAAVAIGAVVRGETPHFDIVAGETARGLMDIARDFDVPVTLGLLTTDTLAQAEARAGGAHGNKGADAAWAALECSICSTRSRQSATRAPRTNMSGTFATTLLDDNRRSRRHRTRHLAGGQATERLRRAAGRAMRRCTRPTADSRSWSIGHMVRHLRREGNARCTNSLHRRRPRDGSTRSSRSPANCGSSGSAPSSECVATCCSRAGQREPVRWCAESWLATVWQGAQRTL